MTSPWGWPSCEEGLLYEEGVLALDGRMVSCCSGPVPPEPSSSASLPAWNWLERAVGIVFLLFRVE